MHDVYRIDMKQLEDDLLGLSSQATLLQSLSSLRVPFGSIPEVLRGLGWRGLVESVKRTTGDRRALYEEGRATPPRGLTMIGRKRLQNVRHCIEQILQNNVPGDLIETGVWRGGAAIYMRAVLKDHDVRDRVVWVADSFQGIPPPDPKYPADANGLLHFRSNLAVSRKEVESNFSAYGLLDDQVRFVPGWFEESLKSLPAETLSLLRIDCDLYGSTITVLNELYGRVAQGGYVIVDDYGDIPACRLAVEDFRRSNNIRDPVVPIDYTGVYWIKSKLLQCA